MKRKILAFGGAIVFSIVSIVTTEAQKPSGIPFDMPAVNVPTFKTDTFNIKNYGAIADGTTLNTQAFAKAIEACSANGGGVVLIPNGLWLTGPIVLKSNVNIHAVQGALVKFSDDLNIYPLVLSFYEGLKVPRCQSPISGNDLVNIAITGKGVFDGSGDAWRPVKKTKLTETQWKTLTTSGGVLNKGKDTWYPTEKSLKGNNTQESGYLGPNATQEDYLAIKDFLRPVMVALVGCKNVLLDGVGFQNSPSWCLHPLMCEHLTLRNLTVRNPWYAQNGDGVDIESCRIGTVTNCSFDVGDDAICIKSGKNEEGRKRNMPTELFVITNCTVYHGHGGFVIGSEMSGGVHNLFVSNCTFLGTDIGLRFKSNRGRGGIVENIYVTDINMINIPAEAISFNMYYTGSSPVPDADEKQPETTKEVEAIPLVDEGTPQFKNFFIKNITCNGAAQAILVQGLPEMTIKNVNLENISIRSKTGFWCIDGEGVKLSNVKLDIERGNAATISNSKDVVLANFRNQGGPDKTLKINGKRTENIQLKNIVRKLADSDIELASDVNPKAIIK
jgi:DNA sulfur modification protein DndE